MIFYFFLSIKSIKSGTKLGQSLRIVFVAIKAPVRESLSKIASGILSFDNWEKTNSLN